MVLIKFQKLKNRRDKKKTKTQKETTQQEKIKRIHKKNLLNSSSHQSN